MLAHYYNIIQSEAKIKSTKVQTLGAGHTTQHLETLNYNGQQCSMDYPLHKKKKLKKKVEKVIIEVERKMEVEKKREKNTPARDSNLQPLNPRPAL